MSRKNTAAVATLHKNVPEIGARRSAPWLQSAYPDPIWTVADTWDSERTATIDFDFPLADGRSLLKAERLYATVKEYAFLVRDSRYSAIDDAETHALTVRNLMYLAHALTLRKIWSFSHLQPYDVNQIVEECRFGADALVHASQRVESFLKALATADELAKKDASGQLPFQRLSLYATPSGHVHSAAIMAACKLPEAAGRFPCVATLIAKAANANGLKVNDRSKLDCDEERPLKNVTVQSMLRWLAPFEQLYAMRRRIEAEAIDFKPFAYGASRVAAVKGVGTERTPTPPPKLALHLLEHSARWVLDRAEYAEYLTERVSIIPLATACWIILAAFSARRSEEINDLREGCIRGDEESGYWLHVYIEKTLQRKEWIPVPTLVARAVEVLSRISAKARSQTSDDRLFQWCDSKGEIHPLDLQRHLDDFAAEVQVPLHHAPGEAPAIWHWSPHQFRRFFAILYFYRFEGANIEALSHHLRHFSLEMTRRYVTKDPEVAALWTDVEWGYMGHVAREIVAGERSIAGGAGKRLKKLCKRLIDLFRRKLQIVSAERVSASVTLVMQRDGMVLTPKPWVTCSCPRTNEAAKKAACRNQQQPVEPGAVGPDFAQASPLVCSNCFHAITEGRRAGVVDAEVSHLERAAVCEQRANTIFGELEAARVIELRQVRDEQYRGATALPQMFS